MPDALRLTLGEGATPLVNFDPVPQLQLKREDANPTGSHKDRAASYQLALAHAREERAVTISSSGNAAIATSRYAALHGITAVVFVHPATDPDKLAAIDGATTIVVVTERAINGAKHLARELKIPNLRPSTNPDAVVGYSTLGAELADVPADAVVLFATSGATALAVARELDRLESSLQVHVVQAEGSTGIVRPAEPITTAAVRSAPAGRLGVRRSRLARQVMEAIAVHGGRGHVVDAERVAQAHEQLRSNGIVVSDESAANLAVSEELVSEGLRVVCVISGAPPAGGNGPARIITAEDEFAALEAVRPLLGAQQ